MGLAGKLPVLVAPNPLGKRPRGNWPEIVASSAPRLKIVVSPIRVFSSVQCSGRLVGVTVKNRAPCRQCSRSMSECVGEVHSHAPRRLPSAVKITDCWRARASSITIRVLASSQSTLWSLNSNPPRAPQVETCALPAVACGCVVDSVLLPTPQPASESKRINPQMGRSLDTPAA